VSTIRSHSDVCDVKNVTSNKIVEAVVQDFKELDTLYVIINKSVKLVMKWNGRVYEGRMASLDFISNGPDLTRTQTASRG
jgi:hypothetical protein